MIDWIRPWSDRHSDIETGKNVIYFVMSSDGFFLSCFSSQLETCWTINSIEHKKKIKTFNSFDWLVTDALNSFITSLWPWSAERKTATKQFFLIFITMMNLTWWVLRQFEFVQRKMRLAFNTFNSIFVSKFSSFLRMSHFMLFHRLNSFLSSSPSF